MFSSTAAPPPRTHHPHRAARATRAPGPTAPHRGPLAAAARTTARTGPREAVAPPTRRLHHPTWRRQLRQRRTTKNRTRKFIDINLKPKKSPCSGGSKGDARDAVSPPLLHPGPISFIIILSFSFRQKCCLMICRRPTSGVRAPRPPVKSWIRHGFRPGFVHSSVAIYFIHLTPWVS